MITKSERLQLNLKELNKQSNLLKAGHVWGDWKRWRKFTALDIKAKKIEIEILKLEIDHLNDAIESYKDY